MQNTAKALPRVLMAVDWCNSVEVSEMHQLLKKWAPLSPLDAMELLSPGFPDTLVRPTPVHCSICATAHAHLCMCHRPRSPLPVLCAWCGRFPGASVRRSASGAADRRTAADIPAAAVPGAEVRALPGLRPGAFPPSPSSACPYHRRPRPVLAIESGDARARGAAAVWRAAGALPARVPARAPRGAGPSNVRHDEAGEHCHGGACAALGRGGGVYRCDHACPHRSRMLRQARTA